MPISIVIFFLLSILISAEDTFDCTGYEDDSYHPVYDADDCRHYWHCIYVNTVYMHAVKRVCPAGTEFDYALRQCETASEVDCIPVRSPHLPRTTSTTKAWRWKYSKLFSRINWTPTMPSFHMTRQQPVFNLGDASDIETTTMMMMMVPEVQTTEQVQVLPATWPDTSTTFSLEELSKNLNALILNHHPSKSRHSGARFFQPGEPENEAEVYTSTTRRRTRHPQTTTATLAWITLPPTTEIITTTISTTTTTTTITTTTTTTTSTIITFSTMATTTTTTTMSLPNASTDTFPMTLPEMTTQYDTTIHVQAQPRNSAMKGRHRRKNMTLYILTSDEHKIRQFSMNHTRGILINCNQLRRRLLGRRRRLRDVASLTSSLTTLTNKNSSRTLFPYHIYFITIFTLFFL